MQTGSNHGRHVIQLNRHDGLNFDKNLMGTHLKDYEKCVLTNKVACLMLFLAIRFEDGRERNCVESQ
jgi:hypothetical protein